MDPAPKPSVSKWLWITLIIVAVLAAGFFAWHFLMGPGKKTETKTTPTPTATTTTPTKTSTEETNTTSTEWLTYTNKTYGYSIQYPPTLTYEEKDGTKNMYFQTAADKAAIAACATRTETECNPSGEINISVDVNAGTTNEEAGKTLTEIITARQRAFLSSDAAPAILGGEPAYEGVMNALSTSYNIISVYNSHTYDLTLTCGADTLDACKHNITADQQRMIDSFTFL
ncbi:hypothetical protein A2V71_01700 [Candidatus Berkelbacteria bacterium RBG_13_40_8]|uniref:PsbP C-terminal domain-containing protein n=1 Tax=Candidatus Berkelbacteria bacterium RBG_13_40_8 TaxID=1797467 RepID=A0A1F5DQ11_9BACT|nr:MAG: hypothetical protein A2V71_01700 [Candidatus Berkelbacteria bacterium RBG_13_40_8]